MNAPEGRRNPAIRCGSCAITAAGAVSAVGRASRQEQQSRLRRRYGFRAGECKRANVWEDGGIQENASIPCFHWQEPAPEAEQDVSRSTCLNFIL